MFLLATFMTGISIFMWRTRADPFLSWALSSMSKRAMFWAVLDTLTTRAPSVAWSSSRVALEELKD